MFLSLSWALLLLLGLLVGRVFPATEAPHSLSGQPWGLVLAGLLLLLIYVTANRWKPEAEVMVPVRRGTRGKGRS